MEDNIWISKKVNFSMEYNKKINPKELDEIYNELLNWNFKIKQERIGTIYIYWNKTTIKEMNAMEYSKWILSKILNVLFRFAHADYIVQSQSKKKSNIMVKLPVYKRKWKFITKEWNYCNSEYVKNNIFFSTNILWFDTINSETQPDWNAIWYSINKNMILKHKEQLWMLIFIIKEKDYLLKEFGNETLNNMLLVLTSFFFWK